MLTEKIAALQDANNQYAFEVDPLANKIEIKRAVESKYEVSVVSVQTLRVQGKVKRLGRFEGKRANWKKAIVKLKQGDSIELGAHT
jgi:large subunit ribosomal protein L23